MIRRLRSYLLFALSFALLMAAPPGLLQERGAASQQRTSPSIRVTKRECTDRDHFPIFVESHCREVTDAVFEVKDPRNIHVETLQTGRQYSPDEWYFAGSSLWTISDVTPDASSKGIRVVSCLAYEPGTDWPSSINRVVQAEGTGSVLLDWMTVAAGTSGSTYRPSFDCIWLDLPRLQTMPSILSLQVFTSESPYLNWTELAAAPLPDVPRGESGEDLEAELVMNNIETGEVYAFVADDYGQVLVPRGTYSLNETASGIEEYFTMIQGQTTLVEVGLAEPGSPSNSSQSQETRMFSTGAFYCDGSDCSPLGGVTIYYESRDGSLSGTCVTEVQWAPNGSGAWCNYPYIVGVPTILTLDESTLPPGTTVTSENPQTYLVPENPDGPLGPVFFMVEPT